MAKALPIDIVAAACAIYAGVVFDGFFGDQGTLAVFVKPF
jgi:hypothetical protein